MVTDGSLVKEEEKDVGVVAFGVYRSYWYAVGTFLAPLILLSLFLMQGMCLSLYIVYTGYTHGIHMVYTWYTHGIHMVCTWYTHGMHMVYTWYAHGMHMVYTWYTHGIH